MNAAHALELPLPALGRALRSREVTSRSLMEESLHRLSTRGRALNAVAALMEPRAQEAAARADRELRSGHDRGPLHGIPYGLKDLFSARGAPTTWGTSIFEGRIIDEDSTVVRRLEAAGAVLVAKLACVQLAGGFGYYRAAASLQGPGKTPWDVQRWSGGSSSGSGSAVAARCVPFAIGSETWGSILTPATLCGVTGLRPSFGRASRAGGMALAWSMDKVGPLAIWAEDALLVLRAMAGPDEADPVTLAPLRALGHPPSKRRLSVAAVLPSALARQGPEIYAAHEQFLKALGEVADVHTVEFQLEQLPARGISADAVAALTVEAEEASAFEGLIERGLLRALQSTDARLQAEVDGSIRAVDYLRAQRLRAKLRASYQKFFEGYDAICTPSLGFNAVPPPRLDEDITAAFPGDDPFGAAGNLLGLPSLGLPGPLARGLPTGMQLLGPSGHEEALTACASALQARSSWHLQRPPGV